MGKNTDNPTCKLCGEAHRIEAGRVCPRYRSKRTIQQPEPKRLAVPVEVQVIPVALPDGVTRDPELGRQYAKGLAASFAQTKAKPKDDRPRPDRRRSKAAARKMAKKSAGVALTSIAHPRPRKRTKAPRDISKASIESIPAPPAIVEAIQDKAAKRKVYLAEKARERRAAEKAGLTLEEYRAKAKKP